MATQLQPDGAADATVIVENGTVYIDGFVETDPDVAEVVSEADDPEAAAHTLLGIGASAVRHASMAIDTSVVERHFEGMVGRFDEGVARAVESIGGAAAGLLDEDDGALHKILADLEAGLTGALGEVFDEDSKSSAVAKIEKVVADVAARLEKQVRAAVDPSSPDSPMARVKSDILEATKEQSDAVLKELREVTIAVAANAARAQVEAKTTAKGFRYEDVIQAALEEIAVVYGDLAEYVGRTTGSSGTQKGDHRVTICTEDTFGMEARVVFESKDKSLTMPKTMQELDQAIQNHGALAGVAVFANQDLAPTAVPLSWWDNKAVVVVDGDEVDFRALQVAYTWARWVARRTLAGNDDVEFDVVKVEAALEAAQRALARHQTIKACHSAARKKIDEASGHVADVIDEVEQALAVIREELKP